MQHQYWGARRESPGQSQPLALPTGEPIAIFSDLSVHSASGFEEVFAGGSAEGHITQ